MALIKCPECGKEISDQATSCPNCGYPINNTKKEMAENPQSNSDDAEVQQMEVVSVANSSPELPKKKNTKRIILLIAAIACVCLVVFGFVRMQQGTAAKNLLSDMEGCWYRPYENIARTLEISSDEIIVSAKSGFDSVDEQAETYYLDVKGKNGDTIYASAYDDAYKEYTITFNDDKTEMTISPAILIDEESETWYYGKPCFNIDGVITKDTKDCYVEPESGIMVYIQSTSVSKDEVKISGSVINPTRKDCSFVNCRFAICDANNKELDIVWPMLYHESEPLKAGEYFEFYCDENLAEDFRNKVSYYSFDFFEVEMESGA